VRDRFLLFLQRIRHHTTFQGLSFDFGASETTARSYYHCSVSTKSIVPRELFVRLKRRKLMTRHPLSSKTGSKRTNASLTRRRARSWFGKPVFL